MSYLLDTHIFIWAAAAPDQLSETARAIFLADEDVYLSSISIYEIEVKRRRDPVLAHAPVDLLLAADALKLIWADITVMDGLAAARLPPIHRDPWDRMIVAQAANRGLTLITRDATLARYDVPILW